MSFTPRSEKYLNCSNVWFIGMKIYSHFRNADKQKNADGLHFFKV